MAISAGRDFGPSRQRPSAPGPLAPIVHTLDRRGLRPAAAVILAVALAVFGGTVDAATGSGLRTLFAICFCGGCLLAALLVRREGLLVTVVMPPLVYVVVALVAGLLQLTDAAGGFFTQELLDLATALVTGAPVLVTGTIVAVVVAVLRQVAHRRRVAWRQAAHQSGRPAGDGRESRR